jgi:hypothetical protein
MLDLVVFGAAVAATKYNSDRHPFLSSSPAAQQSTMPTNAHTSRTNGDGPSPRSRYIFQSTLLMSLLLFSLSMLEAAPAAWLAVVTMADDDIVRHDHGASSSYKIACTFVTWYRVLLFLLSISLLVVHPISLCVAVGSSLLDVVDGMPFVSRLASNNSRATISTPSLPPPSPTRNRHAHRRGHRARLLLVCWNILWIGVRFVLVTFFWRLILRRIIRAMIPYQITRRGGGGGGRSRSCTTTGIIALVAAAVVAVEFYMSPSLPWPSSYLSLATMVSALCAIGMMVASVLNGFGCASLPHANLVGMLLEPTPQALIAKVEEDLDYAIKSLEEKRWLLADATQQHLSCPTSLSPSSFTSSLALTAENQKARKQLREEVIFLTNLVGDMEDDVCEMKSSSMMALEARTAVGRIRGFFGVIFSIVLVVRILFAAASFLPSSVDDGDHRDGDSSRRDPLTSLLLLLVGRHYIASAQQYDMFRQMTSIVLAGALTISQVKSFCRVVGALGRRLSGILVGYASSLQVQRDSSRRGNDVAVLTSSFVMGCYFLACVTVVKMNLPIEYRSSFSAAVGSSNFDHLYYRSNARLMNMIFFASACVSAITLASLFGIQRNNSDRYRIECAQLSGSSASLLQLLA